ncbi:hypothetical protein OH76DRAFT_553970 [Lentinus brumalis]|uniref:Uncharacterized protein n=1 Tax=Lentinus brumalis TaxID=2498619 RepID=A0A371D972_9APHY|nr:hypothetical protein OH76DRAFT_553970 [Polyporus brumalis]
MHTSRLCPTSSSRQPQSVKTPLLSPSKFRIAVDTSRMALSFTASRAESSSMSTILSLARMTRRRSLRSGIPSCPTSASRSRRYRGRVPQGPQVRRRDSIKQDRDGPKNPSGAQPESIALYGTGCSMRSMSLARRRSAY